MRVAKSAVIAWVVGVSVAAVGLGGPVWAEEKNRKPPTQQQAPAKVDKPAGARDLDGQSAGTDYKGGAKPSTVPKAVAPK